jgi:hypothetical protein
MKKYAVLMAHCSLERPSSAYAQISEIIMMVIDHLAPITSMK